jgi:hypothetical protein
VNGAGGADFTSIQAAIADAGTVNGDQIEVAPGTYHESIDFLGKPVRLYSSGGPEVTTLDGFGPLLQEDFSDGNYNGWQIIDQGTIGAPSSWSAATEVMVQSSGMYSNPTTGSASLPMLGTYAVWQAGTAWTWTDYQITLNMKSTDNDAMGVMFRYQDSNNYYRFTWLRENKSQGVGRCQLIRMQNGVVTVLNHVDTIYAAYQWYTIKIIASGANIDILIDNALTLSAVDSTFASGSMALYCWGNAGTYFDDITVKQAVYHVVQCVNGEGPGTVLEGFRITGGKADGISPNNGGGGMYNSNSSPTVIDCIFSGNAANDGGGGMDNNGSSPTVTHCAFNDNTASGYGGGIRNLFSNPTVTYCTFGGNTTNDKGGGMYNNYSSPTVTDCIFSDNTATYGGGINSYTGSLTVTDCTFSGNSATYGGGIRIHQCNLTVTDCIFSGNSATQGGGMYNYWYNSPTVTNCIFSGNSATDYGGGMYNLGYSNPTVTNCTFFNNTANQGTLYTGDSSHTTVTNCILWDSAWNIASVEIYNGANSSTTVTYSNIQNNENVWPGVGNINSDPAFIDAGAGDFRLAWYSPCVDAGDNAAPGLPAADLAGNPRIMDGNDDGMSVVDMGAYELEPGTTQASLGFMSVLIEPNEAVDAGAMWKIEGMEEWHNSGDVIELSPGYYKLEFSEFSEWFEPATLGVEYDSPSPYEVPQQTLYVRVIADMSAVATAPYKPLPVFEIGQIPPRNASHGRVLEFIVDANSLGQDVLFSMMPSFDPNYPGYEPLGTMQIDPNSGCFLYEPDTDDRVAFDVTFHAEWAGNAVEQTVRVTPLPENPLEYEIIGLSPVQDIPDPASSKYITVNEEITGNVSLNGRAAGDVKSVTIQGIEITLDDDVLGNPFGTYNGQVDVKDLTIYAETLTIKDSLWLPQTNVTIYARNLRFIDDGSRVMIKTTPKDDVRNPSVATDGLDARDINLFIESYEADGGLGGRFAMNGTKGFYGGSLGQSGKMTCTLDSSQPLAWLSPYALKMVIAHARDAYLYRHGTETHDILSEYAVLLNLYRDLPQWNGLSAQWRFEFEQMQQESDAILHRIENGLDFFGNPPDWVPALSFEVLKAVYEQEIDHAMRVLYLSYWLQNKANDDTQKMAGLTNSRAQLWAQTEQLKSNYTTINELIGQLKPRADAIAAIIGRADEGGCSGLLCELKWKEEALLSRAQSDAYPWWKVAGRTIATIGSSTITGAETGSAAGGYGAAAGALVGYVVGNIDVFTDESLMNGASLRTDVATQFSQIDFGQATDQWSSEFDSINLDGLQAGGAEGYLNSLSGSAGAISTGLQDVKEALRTTSLSDKDVEAKLNAIKAKDPAFNKLIDEVVALNVEKEAFNRQLAAAMQQISALSNSMTNNVLAIDAMNRTQSELNSGFNPRVMMYVKDMESRSLARLRKYHYYMAKAYEYRLLEPYPNDLNVGEIMDAMVSFASTDGTLSPADFDALKAVYEEQLSTLAEGILTSFLNGHVERSVTTYYTLTEAERAQLNAGKPLTINFFTRGLFPSSRENIRIVDMRVSDIDVSVSGDCGSFAQVIMSMQHPSVSKLQWKDHIYSFRHLAQDTKEPLDIKWESEYNADIDLLEHVEVSASQTSLLWSLLSTGSQSNTLIYSRPGAWADIAITRDDNWDDGGCVECDCWMDIDSLTLEVTYDYYDKDNNLQTLRIAAAPKEASPGWPKNLAPYFLVDTADVSDRQDGTGDFYRIYDNSADVSVNVTAPITFGYWTFDRWVKPGGTTTFLPTRTISFPYAPPRDDQTFYAQYVYEGPILNVADFTQDYGVDFQDFTALAAAWLTTPSDVDKWDTVYDISNPSDEIIDLLDLEVFCENWLKESL